MFSFVFLQEPCEGTCLSEEESINITNNIQELQFNLDKQIKMNGNLNEQIYIFLNGKKWVKSGKGQNIGRICGQNSVDYDVFYYNTLNYAK